ncbi:MAG: rRNA pseudouridine synthase [Bacilli bacterium]|nr:rRNA pseudouridine synthase [Bacilli bacterium]MBN2696858.1 rRNA pseudouridine synthase [Bacilli bacterium]
MERLQKLLQQAGIASRRKAEQMIVDGLVEVDGEIVTELGTKVEKSAKIVVDGKRITFEDKVYYVLNKPVGYVSTTDDEFQRATILDLVPVKERIFPIGRLDYDTSGLLILTNDGDFMNHLIHPRYKVEKEYHVKIEGLLRKESSAILAKGVDLGDFVSQPAKITSVKYDDKKTSTYVNIVITEGKYHQVRRMFEAVGHQVIKLKRYRFGTVTVKDLKEGDYRTLKPHEVKQLWNLAKHGK